MDNPTREQSNAMRSAVVGTLFDRADMRLAELCVLIDAVPAADSIDHAYGRAGLLYLADRLDYLAERARAVHGRSRT